jgi:RNA polymerase sigma-70 factor (ECF subfamily)
MFSDRQATAQSYGPPPARAGAADIEDRQLLQLIIGADRNSFDELYRKYYKRLVTFSMRTTYRPELAEEVAADTLFTVWQKAASFQGNSKVST